MALISNIFLMLLKLFILLSQIMHKNAGFEMEGSHTSFAKFPSWEPCENGTLSFEFRTNQEHGLLLYADDGGLFDFIELKLVARMVRLRLNLGSGTTVITAGTDLNNKRWHTIDIVRKSHETRLVLDGLVHSKNLSGPDLAFGNHSQNSNLFIGGLPVGYLGRLRMLALPSIMFEPRFRGSIRNLMLSQCGGPPERMEMSDYEGVRTTDKDSCAENNPCKNKGLCISKDTGFFCDCVRTGYTGNICEIKIIPPVVTFYGAEYISYDLTSRGDTILSSRDQITMQFKTRQANGLLFYTGEGKDHITVYLQEGGLWVSVNLGRGPYEEYLDPIRTGHRFDDNNWHKLEITRQAREINIRMDNHPTSGTITGEFTMLSSRVLYLAGSDDVKSLEGSRIKENFRGCMKQVFYRADSITLDIIDLAKNQHEFLQSQGTPQFDHCDDLAYAQPITFLTEAAVIKIPKFTLTDTGSITFSFRTNEPTGLLMYSPGRDGFTDFFALELYEGALNLILNLGSGVVKVEATQGVTVNNNQTHIVVLTHTGGGSRSGSSSGSISVDGITKTYQITGKNNKLDLDSVLYIGGFYPTEVPVKMPPQVWSAALKQGYVGCFQELVINTERIDVAQLARIQKVKGVGDYCKATEPLHCPKMPCMHRGRCVEGWNRYICDCSATGYTGDMCHQVAVTLSFNGTQYLTITLEGNTTTEKEDISLRFQTEKESGLLLATSSMDTDDRLIIALDAGKVRVDVSIGGVKQTVSGKEVLSDNEWHTIKVRRKLKRLTLTVDGGEHEKRKINMKNPRLQVDELNLGSANGSFNARLHGGESAGVDVDKIQLGKKTQGTAPNAPENFVGNVQQLIYNRNHFLDMAFRTGQLSSKYVKTNAKVNHEEKLVEYPFTIKSPSAYIMTKKKLKTTFEIYFSFKTTQPDGLILYSGNGNGNDFVALEIYNGKVRYIFDVGNSPRVLESTLTKSLSDNEWHNVSVLRVDLRQHILRVDGSSTIDMMENQGAVHLDTNEEFYIGGAKPEVFQYLPNQVKSTDGYQGCLGSVDLDSGETKNVFKPVDLRPTEYKDDIVEECQGPQQVCQENSCHNAGVCIQKWNSIKCDCDMTSFTGSVCDEVSTAYKFEGDGGVISFHIPSVEQVDTRFDKLALGFKTTQRDAVLTRINSANSDDYIEMELVDGSIFVVYNMGTMNHPIGELFERVNDGKYHVVRFTRSGPNATIQVDNMDMLTKNPTGHQLSIFNNASDIYIGGRKDIRGRIMRPFIGTIAGYVLNGKSILELASDGDPRVTIEKNVQLDLALTVDNPQVTSTMPTKSVISTPSTPQLSSPIMLSTSGKAKSDSDGLISGNGSGCGSDEGDCGVHDPDSLITPVIRVISTTTTTKSTTVKPSPTPKSTTPVKEVPEFSGAGGCEGDDEDCELRTSGQKNVVTDDIEFVRTEEESTATESIIVDGNITEQPTKHTSTVKQVNRSPTARHVSVTPDPSSGRGGPGGGGSKAKTQPPDSDSILNSNEQFKFNIGLIVGIAVSVVLFILILAYALYKYRSRDEGTYKVDEGKNYRYETVSTKAPNQPQQQVNGSSLPKPVTNGPKAKKKGSVKEWYV